MKILELQLKKDVLIVEIPRLADYEFINRECKYLKVGKEEIKLNASTLDKFEVICKGSELIEEIASELVDKSIYTGLYAHYVDKIPVNTYCYNSAIESFISAVESKGFNWLENPCGRNRPCFNDYSSLIQYNGDVKEWQEAEEKTFRNPLIFVKK